ncbi:MULTISPECIES: DNA-processing protein DprA [Bacillus]|jgi:DNA processing protein|uniref:DNA-protecting protein DprA n=3 Tax=Bacillus cereus group TaxID=86661 RepID=A0A5E9V6K5_BACCE|nr:MULTISPECIES: DNA-processing protein DprA [Bacillus]MDV8111156.1 DNA-processing protein DprA [Bacillus sp. BAU-SS-2023]CJD13620.1 DNA processing Smf protein [Streptococcus pneumoniae]AQQ64487.1 protein smf [Bacillus cereus]EJR39599.1 DNA protecting protein DprA [Bacillus cereus VD045]EJR88874.1 DNA protecting protein DprA [Bacillus cereus VD169]
MKRERLLHVHYLLADYWKAMERLLYVDPELKNIYNFNEKQMEHYTGISSKKSSELVKFLQNSNLPQYISYLERNRIFYITIWDEDYPQLLREIQDPPFVLYGKGEKDFLNKVNKLAVVGTREPSLYGHESLKFILHPLLEREWLIVSGFAKGIDTMSHEITVRHHCPTIAILGHGLSFMYPKENRHLYEMWKEYILLLTEYPPHYAPKKWYFPKRNRIISGISKGVLVVEAKSRSGTLITADLALEQNREVFALPGPIFVEGASGTNHLIQQGAKLVRNAEDILEEILN